MKDIYIYIYNFYIQIPMCMFYNEPKVLYFFKFYFYKKKQKLVWALLHPVVSVVPCSIPAKFYSAHKIGPRPSPRLSLTTPSSDQALFRVGTWSLGFTPESLESSQMLWKSSFYFNFLHWPPFFFSCIVGPKQIS